LPGVSPEGEMRQKGLCHERPNDQSSTAHPCRGCAVGRKKWPHADCAAGLHGACHPGPWHRPVQLDLEGTRSFSRGTGRTAFPHLHDCLTSILPVLIEPATGAQPAAGSVHSCSLQQNPSFFMSQDLPSQAEIVIVGGGAIGCSIAYHL